jgi:hypothetical protein
MKAKAALSCVVLCLIAVVAAVCSLQHISGERMVRADAPVSADAAQIVEAEDCLAGRVDCRVGGDWEPWDTPEASNGRLITNEHPPGSATPVPVTLTLENLQGTGIGVVYRQDTWYGNLGVRMDHESEYCIKQKGVVRNQAEACFSLERGEPVTLTLFLTGTEETDIITGVISADAMRIYDIAEPCGTRDSLCDRGIIVPAYFEPDLPDGYWDRLVAAARRLGKRFIVIANVDSGPGTAERPDYTEVISAVVTNGGKVIGYVYTCFGNESDPTRPWCPRPDGDIEGDIDRWFDSYGNDDLDGIFFDEVALTQDKVPFYQDLYHYVQEKKTGATVIFNFGAEPHEDYAGIGSSILCTFEGPFACFVGWLPPHWLPKGRSCAIVYETDPDLSAALDPVSRKDVGWTYVTTDTNGRPGANPYDTLPDYFEELVNRLACTYLPIALNRHGRNGLCQITIDPTPAIEGNAIEANVFGEWSDSCVPVYHAHQVTGHTIEIDLVWDYPPYTACALVITPWRYTVDIGPLARGTYEVHAYINRFLCDTKSFEVVSR